MYKFYNPNPQHKSVGDCVVRAICKAINQDWRAVFVSLFVVALKNCDMPSANYVWAELLTDMGYKKHLIDKNITIKEFSEINRKGTFVVGTGSHVVCVDNGDYYDSWDSGNEIANFFMFFPPEILIIFFVVWLSDSSNACNLWKVLGGLCVLPVSIVLLYHT